MTGHTKTGKTSWYNKTQKETKRGKFLRTNILTWIEFGLKDKPVKFK